MIDIRIRPLLLCGAKSSSQKRLLFDRHTPFRGARQKTSLRQLPPQAGLYHQKAFLPGRRLLQLAGTGFRHLIGPVVEHRLQMTNGSLPLYEIAPRQLRDLFLQTQTQLIKTRIGILHIYHPIAHTVEQTGFDCQKMPPIRKSQQRVRRIDRLKPGFHPFRQILPIKVLVRISQKTLLVFCKKGGHLGKNVPGKQPLPIGQDQNIRPRYGDLPKPLHGNRFTSIYNARFFIFISLDPLQIRIGLPPELLLITEPLLFRRLHRSAVLRPGNAFHTPHESTRRRCRFHRHLIERIGADTVQIILRVRLFSLRVRNAPGQHRIPFAFLLVGRHIIGCPIIAVFPSTHQLNNPLFCKCLTVSIGILVTSMTASKRLSSSPESPQRDRVMFGSSVGKA